MNFQIEDRAYKKVMLHSLKYSKADCLGVLIGRKQDTEGKRTIVITDAIPLFHQKVMSGALEIAFDMIESSALVDEKSKIVGIYEAPIIGAESQPVPSALAVSIVTTIKQQGHFNEPSVLSVNAVTQRRTGANDSTN